jgi:photosystem II stability/assembly factor-like uncharacterized protein
MPPPAATRNSRCRPPAAQRPPRFMLKNRIIAVVAALAAAVACGARQHDMYVCAAINKNYVIGSKLVTLSGIYERAGDGSFQHVGTNYPAIFQLSFDPRDRNVFYAASLNGVLCTRDGGRTWRIGTGWDMTEPKDVFVDQNAPDNVYLALPDGLAVSRDRGLTWVRHEKGLPERGKYTQVVKVDRAKTGRVLAGCESGIYLSDDAAKSWKRVFATSGTTVTDLRQSPHDPKLWVATTQSDGVQLSSDGGKTWRKLAGVPSEEALYNVAFDATHPQRMAVSSWTYGVYTTEDGGKTWTERNAGLPDEHCVFRVGIDPDNGRMFAAVYRDALFISDDFGRTWKRDGLEGSTVYNFVFVPRSQP